jgi:hypothetical protein
VCKLQNNMHKYTVIVTKNNSDYVNWQTDILYESFLEYHKDDSNFQFLALVSKDKEYKTIPRYPFIYCKHYDLLNNDDYIVYNRILNLQTYLNNIEPSENRYIILLDPDFIFLKKFDLDIKKTTGQFCSYLINHEVIDFYNKNYKEITNEFYYPISCPYIINEVILFKIIDEWLELTIQFRSKNKEKSPLYKNWICEMYAFAFALLDQKIEVDVKNFCESPPFGNYIPDNELYFYHYCYEIKNNKDDIIFDKKNYKFGNVFEIENLKDQLENDQYKLLLNLNKYTKNILNLDKDIKSDEPPKILKPIIHSL